MSTDPASPSRPSTAAPADLTGRVLGGDFRLLRRLGQGGMGQVYLAEQLSLKRKVAVKVMRTDIILSATAFERFRAEAEAVARVNHANIVGVHRFGAEDGLHYIALEYVEGRNLREQLAKKGTVEVPLALSIMRQVASALQRASELGIVHRDIKPENILLTRRGEAKVADFGLSRVFASDHAGANLTQTGIAMGTPLYMSPEQIQGQPIDPRTDIYSFGVMCYHMLAGKPPFAGQTAFELVTHHVNTPPPPLGEQRPDLPPELCAVVHKMMAKRPEERYQTCGELLKDIARVREVLAGQKTQTSGSVAGSQTGTVSATLPVTLPTRRRLAALAAGSLVLALGAGAVAAWVGSKPAAEPVVRELPPGDDAAVTERKRQERFLREAVDQYANPDEAHLQLGMLHCLELGLFYLDHNQLDEADQFFSSLVANPHRVKPYQALGKLGRAIVLGLHNQPAESNKLFTEVLTE